MDSCSRVIALLVALLAVDVSVARSGGSGSLSSSLALSAASGILTTTATTTATVAATATRTTATTTTEKDSCKITEFRCRNGTCINLSRYCNGFADCIDKSDEPKSCTACNGTYFGEISNTYSIELRTPKELPFVCHLNFTAAGGVNGDIIQINFDKFNLGRIASPSYGGASADGSISDGGNHALGAGGMGCVDGYMTITENGLSTLGGGRWCGSAWGYTVYYSESHSINVTLRLDKFYQPDLGSNLNFEFKLSYKFLRKTDAKLRYNTSIWTGDSVAGTYCNKNFYDCDKRICRIRSPNFPGIYPRNLTCKYRIHHRTPPAGLHAMIIVRQPEGHRLHIKEQVQLQPAQSNRRILRSWDQCDTAQDYLTIRDGRNAGAPELARLCGGDIVPDIISSGPDMLIEFRTTPYDTLNHPVPVSYLLGFELQVHIMFANVNSQAYVKQPGRCDFLITAFENPFGELDSPQHTLPPDTVCRYHFQGRRHEVVWLAFVKYHSTLDAAMFEPPSECFAQLRLWDGRWPLNGKHDGENKFVHLVPKNLKSPVHLVITPDVAKNASLIAEVCREEIPKLCSRSLIARGTRPCSSHESYLSTGADLTIEYRPSASGSARLFGPAAAFRLRYEFVDTALGGAPLEPQLTGPSSMPEPAALVQSQVKSCNRVYRSTINIRGSFRSPSNVFLYGRGGAANISCTIRFDALPGESVRLSITRARFGGRQCQNIQNRSGRWHCHHSAGGPRSELRIGEIPWLDVAPLPRDCICSDVSGSLTLAPLAANRVEVTFAAFEMGVDQDFRDFYFEGRFEFTKDGCDTDWSARRLRGRSGDAFLRPVISCSPLIQPWLLEQPADGGFFVLKLKGFWMPTMLQSSPPCPTDARITIYSTSSPHNSRDLCPFGLEVVAFSDGWDNAPHFVHDDRPKSMVIELRSPRKPAIEPFDYKFAWMEVMPGTDCPHRCPELQACIAPELWCDGTPHCPSGHDERPLECDIKLPLSPLHVGLAAATLTILLSLAAGLAACARRKRGEKKHFHQTHSDGGPRYAGHHHHHHHHHIPPHVIPPIYLDNQQGKDSFC